MVEKELKIINVVNEASDNNNNNNNNIKNNTPSAGTITTNNNTINDTNNDTNNNIRHVLGNAMHSITSIANDHLIAVRYATGATVVLVGLFSISQTPLFFRYKSLLQLPSTAFASNTTNTTTKRRTTNLTCRMMGRAAAANTDIITGEAMSIVTTTPEASVAEAAGKEDEHQAQPIVVYLRHLSPMGRLLSKQQLKIAVKHSPSSSDSTTTTTTTTDATDNTLLRIQLHGIVQQQSPHHYYQQQQQLADDDLIQSLTREHALVKCQFISLLLPSVLPSSFSNQHTTAAAAADGTIVPTAIARLYYWKPRRSFLGWLPLPPQRLDLQATLVQSGQARPQVSNSNTTTTTTNHVDDISTDGAADQCNRDDEQQYFATLAALERDAIRNRRGMWASSQLRQTYFDLVSEADCWEGSATWYPKMWRRWFTRFTTKTTNRS